jgi:hypothetical protein
MSSLSSYVFPSISLYEQGEYLFIGNDNEYSLASTSVSFLQEQGFPVEGQIVWPFVLSELELVYTELSVFANTRKASIIGLYPVQRHKLPARLSSIWSSVGGCFLDLNSAYIDITKPGVQNPHWEPCALAKDSYKICKES